MNKRKRVLITGESGSIGRLLYFDFKRRGYTICNELVDSTLKSHNKKDLPFVFDYPYEGELDISDLYCIEKTIRETKPDVLIHTAAYVNTDKCDEDAHGAYYINAQATLYLATAFNYHCPDSLFVNFSTTATMDPSDYRLGKPINQYTSRKPLTWYGQTKYMGELIAKKMVKKWINFLPVFLYGTYPYDTSSIWSRLFVANLENRKYEIALDENNYKQYEFVINVIPLIRRIIENSKAIGSDVVIAGPEIRMFRRQLSIANEAFKNGFGKSLKYVLHPSKDYLANHVADYQQMLSLAKVSEQEFLHTRIDFEKGMWCITEAIKNGYKLRKKV